MKNPRIIDFDPNTKILELKSSLDKMPAIEKPKAGNQPPLPAQAVSTQVPQSKQQQARQDTSPTPPPARSANRSYLRRTFDFYEDQSAFLKKVSLQEQLDGKEGSMNEMVREAIDRTAVVRVRSAVC